MSHRRVPSLVVPFAAVGGAAGWLSADVIDNPLVGVGIGDGRAACPAAACAAVVAAAIGAVLTRWCATRMDWHPPRATWTRLGGAVLLGGALAGGAVTAVMDECLTYVHIGALIGAAASLAFIPVCWLVLQAAKRAERARLGSLVAGSDRRAVWGILMAALSVPAAATVLDWPFTRVVGSFGHVAPPWAAIAMLLAAFGVLAASLAADLAALARTKRSLAGAHLEEVDAGQASPELPRLDLGLGAEVRAAVTRGSAVYRSRDRAVALVLGCPDEAAWALHSAVRRDVLGLTVASVVLGAHLVAACALGCALPDRPPFQAMRCAAPAAERP